MVNAGRPYAVLTVMDRRPPTIHSGSHSGSDVLHRRACTVFGRCAHESPIALPALAAAFVEYLVAWRDTAPDQVPGAAVLAAPPLHERVVRLDALLRRAEQTLHVEPDSRTVPDPVGRLETEAGAILAAVREVIRTLPQDRPEAQRLRLALVEAWGRYDDALTGLRARGPAAHVSDVELAVLAKLRDALLQHMDSARSMAGELTGVARP